jgi:dTDP-4-dehydrorhamnose reductase
MKIAVTGANGQLGKSIEKRKDSIIAEWIFTDIDGLDITNKQNLAHFFSKNKPDILINCAAYTAVDKAEDEIEKATLINTLAPSYLAELCKQNNCHFIHVSTDYVFDGKTFIPYKEDDSKHPETSYGLTKSEGEDQLLSINSDSIILRTSWLYSEFGNNFLKTMIRLGKEKEQIGVVFDQTGTPTYAGSLAEGIIHVLSVFSQTGEWKTGIYHYSNQGVCSWFDFAHWIMDTMNLACRVMPIESKDFPTKAKRPHFSVLNKSKFETTFNYEIPYWIKSAEECINNVES